VKHKATTSELEYASHCLILVFYLVIYYILYFKNKESEKSKMISNLEKRVFTVNKRWFEYFKRNRGIDTLY